MKDPVEQNTNTQMGEPQAQEPAGHNHKKTLFMATSAFVILGLLVGGLWFFMNTQPRASSQKVTYQKLNYKVGLMTLDNYQQTQSVNIKRGLELAQEQIKDSPISIEIISKPTDCKADLAKTAMEEFVREGVIAVLGEFCSDATLGAAPVANEAGIPLISGGSTSSAITTAGDYVFRTVPSDVLSTAFTAEVMYKNGVRKLAILHSDDTYGNSGSEALKTNFEKLGGQVVSDEKYQKTQTDVRAELGRNMASNPDAFYTIGATGINPAILIQKKEIGFTAQMYGPETFKSERNITLAEGAAEGIYVIGNVEPETSFAEKYRAAFGEPVTNIYAATYYDGFMAIYEGLKAGATNSRNLADMLHNISFSGASNQMIDFDDNGDVKGSFALYTIKDNQTTLVDNE